MSGVPIYWRGHVVMYVINSVAIRHARPDEMLRKPPAWAYHVEVLQQVEAAHVCHLRIECAGHIYTVPWSIFSALSAPLDRGWGQQRFLLLQYWSIDGRPPERSPRVAPAAPRQLALF